MSKKQKTILVLVAVVVFAVSFISLFCVMKTNNKHTEGYDSLMETAEKFDEMYSLYLCINIIRYTLVH